MRVNRLLRHLDDEALLNTVEAAVGCEVRDEEVVHVLETALLEVCFRWAAETRQRSERAPRNDTKTT